MTTSSGRLILSDDWKGLSRRAGLPSVGGSIRVKCGDDRFQEVHVDDTGEDVLRIWSRVASMRRLETAHPEIGGVEQELWLTNRYRELVGFKVVGRGTVIGEAWLPKIDLTAEEWELYVRTVAVACDRMEYLWTGADRE
jgi:hypothetical protein